MATPPWIRLELHVPSFDAARFAPCVTACQDSGIRLSTLADLGDTPAHHRALYELNRECAADIPERGPFFTYEEFRRRRIAVPGYAADGVVIAMDGDTWCGLAATSDHRAAGFVFNEMTGVRAGYRGRGVSLAMKTFGMGFAARCGVDTVRTLHHPANHAAIAMNRRLGYVDADFPWPPPAAA